MRIPRLVAYLILNVFVSVSATLAVLTYWEKYQDFDLIDIFDNTYSEFNVKSKDISNIKSFDDRKQIISDLTNEKVDYQVLQGDTIEGIALMFDITLNDLIDANNINDPNKLEVNQILIIPATSLSVLTERPMATEVIRTQLTDYEFDAANYDTENIAIRSVEFIGDVEFEKLIIVNFGKTISLVDWSIVGDTGQYYQFPDLSLFTNGQVTLYSKIGTNSVTDLFWDMDESVWIQGDKIKLVDNVGDVRAIYEIDK